MRKVITYILSFTAILLFLASSTGISFVIHHCSAKQTKEIHLFTNDDQCKHKKAARCCCANEEEENNEDRQCNVNKNYRCCENIKGYFKISDDYTFDRNNINISSPIAFISITPSFTDNPLYPKAHIYKSESPPLYRSGKGILCFNSQFRI